jgi:hypothetical protein
MSDENRRTDAAEIASAIIISIAGLGSSWATYQAGLWDGEQAGHYTRANNLRVKASQTALEGDALAGVEIQIFNAWLQAKAQGEEPLARFYEARVPPRMRPAFDAWLAQRPLENPAAPPTPFGTRFYQRPGLAAGHELDRQADESFEQGQYANRVSDAFQQAATILALALFFGGIGQVFRMRTSRIVLLAIASAATLLGFFRLISLPMQFLGWGPPG